jgi:hypothetical protein
MLSSMVREGGLEPPRGCPHKVLSLARLPFRHSRKMDRLRGLSGEPVQFKLSSPRAQFGFGHSSSTRCPMVPKNPTA